MQLNRTASYLRGRPGRLARLAGAAAGTGEVTLRYATGPARRRMARARDALAPLTDALADHVLGRVQHGDLTGVLPAIGAASPGPGGDRLRVPACFHSFDQHPDDARWLVGEFRRRYPEPDVPLCVVGVRTSGCYLAPLQAAALRAEGTSTVRTLSYRPGVPFDRTERAVLKAVARAGGRVLITDDPPASGYFAGHHGQGDSRGRRSGRAHRLPALAVHRHRRTARAAVPLAGRGAATQ